MNVLNYCQLYIIISTTALQVKKIDAARVSLCIQHYVLVLSYPIVRLLIPYNYHILSFSGLEAGASLLILTLLSTYRPFVLTSLKDENASKELRILILDVAQCDQGLNKYKRK